VPFTLAVRESEGIHSRSSGSAVVVLLAARPHALLHEGLALLAVCEILSISLLLAFLPLGIAVHPTVAVLPGIAGVRLRENERGNRSEQERNEPSLSQTASAHDGLLDFGVT
jgi:hypothetical protein